MTNDNITTAEELDALPDGAVIQDVDGDVFKRGVVTARHRARGAVWHLAGYGGPYPSEAVHLPATVLHDPSAPPASDTTALVAKLRGLIESFVDADDCWFDHSGGCQAHGYLSLGYDKQQCPHAEAKEWLEPTAARGLTVTDETGAGR